MKTERIIELAKADYLEDCGWVQFDNGWRHPDTEEEVYDDCAALKYENKGCGATDVVDSVCAHAIRLARLEGVKNDIIIDLYGRIYFNGCLVAFINAGVSPLEARSFADAIGASLPLCPEYRFSEQTLSNGGTTNGK